MASSRRAWVTAAAAASAWLLGASFGWGSRAVGQWLSDLALPVLAFWAAWSLLGVARRRQPGHRRPYALLSVAAALWGSGEAVWSVSELVGGQVAFPSAADPLYLAATPVACAGLLSLTKGTRQRSNRARALLDGCLVAGGLLSVGWLLLLQPVVAGAEGGPVAVAVAIAYPVMDVVLATVAVLACWRSRPEGRQTLVLLAVAAGTMSLADGAYTLSSLEGSYTSGGFVDAGWVAAYVLMATSAWCAADTDDLDSDRVEGRITVLLPYGVVLASVLAIASTAALSSGRAPVAIGLLAVLLVALLTRQGLSVVDNAALATRFSERERHFRSLVHGAKDMVLLCDAELRTTYVSPSSEAVMGLAPSLLRGMVFWDLVHPDDLAEARLLLDHALTHEAGADDVLLRCRVLHGSGAWIDTESTLADLRDDPSVQGIVITTRDISDRTALESRLRSLALEDPLTGLANRTLLRERLEHALLQRRPAREPLGLLLIDLDGFKPVNDTYGHATGDALLQTVAQRLLDGVRVGDTVARLGGDEFAVLLEVRGDGGLRRGGLEVAERLLTALHQPFSVHGRTVSVGASMGLAIAGSADDADALMRQADFAMYASKDAGRGRVTVFNALLAAESRRRSEMAQSLGTALAAGQLRLAYQPVVDLRTGRVTGAEALARWDHPTWGPVSPAEFVPVAERTGLIVQLGHWALVTAARQARVWQDEGRELVVAVNVSVRQLGPEFVQEVAEVLSQTRLEPGRLTLEITESVLVDDERTLRSLEALGSLGVRLSLDDFGTGWSSLSYLRRLPVDVLKLDSTFVAGLGSSQADAVSRTVIQLGSELGLEVLAEGVETVQQRDLLLAMGCHSAQGWLFGPAGPPEDVMKAAFEGVVPHQAGPPGVEEAVPQGARRTSM